MSVAEKSSANLAEKVYYIDRYYIVNEILRKDVRENVPPYLILCIRFQISWCEIKFKKHVYFSEVILIYSI